jgi:transposase
MQTPLDVGVDVAKDSVMAACANRSFAPHQFANRRRELCAWLKTLPRGSRIGLEATGRYHVPLADLAHEHGLIVYVLNPRDLRHYAKGLGRRGKTDRVDAEVIARYVAKEHAELHAYAPASPEQRAIDRLLKRRAKIVALKGALRATGEDLCECRAQLKDVVRRLDLLIARIDGLLRALTQASEPHRASSERLQTIVGIGPLVSTSLANTFNRIPFRNADAFVAYTGYDPRPFDSGKKIGRRRLSKRGPGELRRLLFNAAMSAAQTPVWKPTYERYRARGLPSTAALVILARRIARVAWSVHFHQTAFNPALLAA